jgi:hypothetical protein
MLTLAEGNSIMNACLIRIATTIALIGVVAVAFTLVAARHAGMLATCTL